MPGQGLLCPSGVESDPVIVDAYLDSALPGDEEHGHVLRLGVLAGVGQSLAGDAVGKRRDVRGRLRVEQILDAWLEPTLYADLGEVLAKRSRQPIAVKRR